VHAAVLHREISGRHVRGVGRFDWKIKYEDIITGIISSSITSSPMQKNKKARLK
jgi:hypothetical protein